MLTQNLALHHSKISSILAEFFDGKGDQFSEYTFADDVFSRLEKFNIGGKMIRGGLLVETYRAFSNTNENSDTQIPEKILKDIYKIAAVIELFSSGLLIHDDITDRDEMRRGNPSIYKQYQEKAKKNSYTNNLHYGTSMATFVGDVDFFLSYSLIAETSLEPTLKNKLLSFFSDELIGVSLAQLQDITLSHTKTATKEAILEMYRLKTARYSIVLPMYVGALLTGQTQETLETIEKIAENIGIVFQIKDDEIGIFGDSNVTGKPCGNDIREGKKTLFWWYGMELADADTKKKLTTIFGNAAATENDIVFVRQTLKNYDGISKIEQLEESLVDSANALKITIPEQAKSLVTELITYNLNRSK